MITKKPLAENYAPIYVEDVITGYDNNDVYCIENVSNRPFRWDGFRVKRDCLDEIVTMLKTNILDEKRNDKYYLSLGRTGVSEVESSTKEKYKDFYDERKVKSIIEGGHRIKIPFATYIALLILKFERENRGNEKLDSSILYNEFGEQKLNYVGKREFSEVYELIKNNNVNQIIEIIAKNKKETTQLFASIKNRKTVFNVITFTYYYFNDILNNDEVLKTTNIDTLIRLVLKNIYYREEIVSKENKWNYFDNCNTKGLIVDVTDNLPRQIASLFNGSEKEKIIDEFDKVYELSVKTQKNKKFATTKKGIDCFEFVLDIAYKMFLLKENCIESIPNSQGSILDDRKYGVNVGIEEYGFCSTIEKTLEYVDDCYKICDFIYHSLDNNVNIYKTYFMFRNEDRNKYYLWWYTILPLYVLKTYIKSEKIQRYIYDYMCKMKAFQFSNKSVTNGSNVQSYVDHLFKLCKVMLTHIDDEKEIINILANDFSKEWFGRSTKDELKYGLEKETMQNNWRNIRRTLIWNEYIFITKFNVNHDTLYRLMLDENFNADLDHIIPNKMYNNLVNNLRENTDDSITGEIALLESSLNRSKGDKIEKNAINYSESGFYLTSFLLNTTKKNLSRDTLRSIDFKRYSNEELNNFNVDDVNERNSYLIDTYVDWIYDWSFDFNTLEENDMDETIIKEEVYANY